MEDITYTKGIYTAIATTRELHHGRFQGMVTLTCHGDESARSTVHEVEAASSSHAEALEEAKALAHRILGKIE